MTTSGGSGTRRVAPKRCIRLVGKGAPDGAALREAIAAVSAVVVAVRDAKRQTGHEFKPPEPEVRFGAGPGRAAAGWTVEVRVPSFVSARDVRAAVDRAGARRPLAMRVQLVQLAPAPARPGRDHQQGQLRKTLSGKVAQHRARDLLR